MNFCCDQGAWEYTSQGIKLDATKPSEPRTLLTAVLSELVRATLIMFREFNTLELTFCVEFLIILSRETLTNSLTLTTLMTPMTQAW